MAFNQLPSKTTKEYKFNCDLYNYEEILKQLKEKPTFVEDHITSWDEKKGIWIFSANPAELLGTDYCHLTGEGNLGKLVIILLHVLNHYEINIKSHNIGFSTIQGFFNFILRKLNDCGLNIFNWEKLSAYNLLVIMDGFLDLFRVSKILEEKLAHNLFHTLVCLIKSLYIKYILRKPGAVNDLLYYVTINLWRRIHAIKIIFWHMTKDVTVIITSKDVVFSDNYDKFEGLDDLWFKNPFTQCKIIGNEVTIRRGFFEPYPDASVYENLSDEFPNLLEKSCYSSILDEMKWLHEECKKPKFQERNFSRILNFFCYCTVISYLKIKFSINRSHSEPLPNNFKDELSEEFIFMLLTLAMKYLVKLVDGKYKKLIPLILSLCFKALYCLRIPDIVLKVSLNSVLLLSHSTHQFMKAVKKDLEILREMPADVVVTIAMIVYWVTKEHRKRAFHYKVSDEPITKSLPNIENVDY